MKANVVHGDFNPCGGAERLSLVTIRALSEMGMDLDLTTLKVPNISKLENTYGKNLVSVIENIDNIYVVNILDLLQRQKKQQEDYPEYNYDITINTNGDAAPYYHSSFSNDNAITYCHFPSTKYHIQSESVDYLKTDLGMTAEEDPNNFSDNNGVDEATIANNLQYCKAKIHFSTKTGRRTRTKQECYEAIEYGYSNLMRNSRVITNSEFSRRAITNAFGLSNICIISPPIDIETFRNVDLANENNERDRVILVISRIAPHKQIENAIQLAKVLKDNNIGKGMRIVGNLYHYFFDYYTEIKQKVIELGLTDYIKFEINASLEKLLCIIQRSGVYFHPMIGDHFGMTVVEVMAAGLIPVVSNKGGPAEFVPQRYRFETIEQAAEIIDYILNGLPKTERIKISDDIDQFSNSYYIRRFQSLVNELISKTAK